MLFEHVDLRSGTFEALKARKSELAQQGYVYWGKMKAFDLYAKAETEFEARMISCNSFVLKMQHSIETSHERYGEARKGYPVLCKAIDCVEERLDYYLKGKYSKDIAPHNKDYLVDVANFAMIESMFPVYSGFTVSKPDATAGWRSSFSTEFTQSFCSKSASAVELQEKLSDWATELAGKNFVERISVAISHYRKEHTMLALKAIGYFAWREYDMPSFKDAFYDINQTGANLSPGLAGGISYKELMDS